MLSVMVKRVMMKRGAAKLAVVLTLALLLSSCGLVSQVSDDTFYMFLLDKSASTLPSKAVVAASSGVIEPRGEYMSALRQIVSALGPGSEVSGALIDGASLSVTSLPIRAELPAFDQLFDNQMVFRDEVVKRKKELLKQFEVAVNEGESAQSTCIIDALLLAQNVLEGSSRRRKVIVVLGDMIEDCQAVDFDRNSRPKARGLPRNEDEVKQLLDELQKQRRLPNLRGVVVCVYGAKGGQQGDNDGRRYLLIQSFWKEFFNRAGAELRVYGPFGKFPVVSDSAFDLSLPEDDAAAASGSPTVPAERE